MCTMRISNTKFCSRVQTSYSTSPTWFDTKCACTQIAFAVSNTLIGILLGLIYMMLLYMQFNVRIYVRPTVGTCDETPNMWHARDVVVNVVHTSECIVHTPATNTGTGLRTDGTECAQHRSAVHSRALNPAFDKHTHSVKDCWLHSARIPAAQQEHVYWCSPTLFTDVSAVRHVGISGLCNFRDTRAIHMHNDMKVRTYIAI